MRNRVVHSVIVTALLFALPKTGLSQQSENKPENSVAALAQAPKHYYKLNFVLRESDEGKPINQRTFTMSISAQPPHTGGSDWWSMRAGTRLPVSAGKETEYVDVGVNLDIKAEESPEGLQMQITAEISSAIADNAPAAGPRIRQVKVRSAILAPVSKPSTVFTVEDPASRHQFELEVTPTRER